MRTLSSGSLATTDSDYGYIGVFIGFLKQIFAMFQKLLAGIDLDTGEPLKKATTEDDEEE